MRRFFHSIAKAFAVLIDRHGAAANTDATHTSDGFYLGRDGNVYNDDGSLKMKNPSPEVPGTLGELFASVGGWMAGGELGYPSFGSMDALRIYTQRSIRAALAAAPLTQVQPLLDREEFIRQVSVSIAEMDRDSPEDQPEMMLVTPQELQNTMRSVFASMPDQQPVTPSGALADNDGGVA